MKKFKYALDGVMWFKWNFSKCEKEKQKIIGNTKYNFNTEKKILV